MKLYLNIIVYITLTNIVLGQNDSLFFDVEQAQNNRIYNSFSSNRDSVFSDFDKKIQALLKAQNNCNILPNTKYKNFLVNKLNTITKGSQLAYGFMNNIVITSTNKLKIYSWDNLEGGSSHTYTNYILYESNSGSCVVKQLDTNVNNIEIGYYNLIQIKNYYIAFGYGTYGAGKHHYVVKVFKYKNGELVIPNEDNNIVIEANRSQNIDLKYNPKTQTITYKAFEYDNDIGFYSKNSKTVTLVFKKGKLIE